MVASGKPTMGGRCGPDGGQGINEKMSDESEGVK